jgi:hypothetical protein
MYNRHNSRMNERRKWEGCPNIPVIVTCLSPTRISRNAVWIEVTSHKEKGREKLAKSIYTDITTKTGLKILMTLQQKLIINYVSVRKLTKI